MIIKRDGIIIGRAYKTLYEKYFDFRQYSKRSNCNCVLLRN